MKMNLDIRHAAEAKLRVMQHLPPDADLALIVLKGHLLIEEQLHAMVRSAVKNPEALDEARLSFFNLACVAKALFYEERLKRIWDSIFAINTLRNDLAHALEPPKLEERIRKLGLAMSQGEASGGAYALAHTKEALLIGIAIICGVLSAKVLTGGKDGTA